MLPNHVQLLTGEDRHRLIPRLDGPCYELAIALHRNTGWPMVGLILDSVIRHAGIRRPDGSIHDARGPINEQVFAAPFLETAVEHIIRPITESELLSVREISLSLIRHFSCTAPILWPDLPYPEDHPMRKAIAFADELRELSLRHGICLRTSVPAERIHFASLKGDEQYVLAPTDDGFGWTMRRDIVR
ncbi:MAG: hypothetical protein KA731_03050 [Candidatus Moranbacteria bacterium]|nr:hypothetical protein [Candidatus Moranbacteria bacterium]MBP6034342.1 hypothetical protein [Candidatus Moranbacteria bacterium]MBP7695793.1 hypothetical protein [Candidatus Moranbacteria bacterium]